jgi:hypothetical protein
VYAPGALLASGGVRALPLLLVTLVALCLSPLGAAYDWPLKPFDRPHPIRGAFGDPRFHVGAESEISAFHFGVDIVARDGEPVYAVEPGYAHVRRADVTITRRNGRAFGYWHIRPVVRNGHHVRRHQLLGYVRPGWGHVHFAESFRDAYKNPLRPGALTPFYDRTPPSVDSVELLGAGGAAVDPAHVTGIVDVVANAYDTPPLVPPFPWQVARLAPASLWWTLNGPDGVAESTLVSDFDLAIPPNGLYGWTYAPGTYQNKPNRPGRYLFWLAHSFDTSGLPDGTYRLDVFAEDTRGNIGMRALDFRTANGVPATRAAVLEPRRGAPQPW